VFLPAQDAPRLQDWTDETKEFEGQATAQLQVLPWGGAPHVAAAATLTILACYSYTTVICADLVQDITVQYWLGTSSAIAGFVVAPLAAAVTFCGIMMRSPVPKLAIIVGGFVSPAVVGAVVGYSMAVQASAVRVVLSSNDCFSFTEKRQLEVAWRTADKLKTDCGTTALEDCPEYGTALGSYERDWTYLRRLEQSGMCTGFCDSGAAPLWYRGPVVHDSCSAAASSSLKTVERIGQQLEMFSVLAILVVVLAAILPRLRRKLPAPGAD